MAQKQEPEEIQVEKAYIQIKQIEVNAASKDVKGAAAAKLTGKTETAGTGEIKTFPVQFNPGMLSFSAEGGGKRTKQNFQKKEDGKFGQSYSYEPVTPRINLSIKLIFDRTIYKDSNVQTEVEGFLSAARNPCTRQISFHWEKLVFEGILGDVSAEYTMFDKAGIPVRASVDFTITCKDNKIAAGELYQDYKALFAGKR